ncbi:MAG: bifunctional pyr operon transcriptional regulator/uracil phosphoribosyltransferase PyrR [Gammaproteobacteria bacterium]|nr:bifunctional pyr operon transcriptional regulator/uracil phosphoribosyltransferase PyrR [Gammaproteobacteria bacterium]
MSTNTESVEKLVEGMASQLTTLLDTMDCKDPLVIGIHTGGIWVAELLSRLSGIKSPAGQLNIAFYRDDFSRIGIHPTVAPSNLPIHVEDRHIILVDDVLFTGRTIRAAMNEIFDYGRPASISLAVLVDRSGRELPIQAQVIGKTLPLKANEHVKLLGPEPLALEINTTE